MLLKKLGDLWLKLIGGPSNFSLERRIFHSISIGLILLLCIYVPYNFFAGLFVASISAFVIGLLFFYQYYHSRFRDQKHSNILIGTIGLLVFSINYFSNAGIDGSTDLIWPAYLLLIFAISPYKQHVIWLIVFFSTFVALHIVEFFYPFLVQHPFNMGEGQFIDRVTAFPLPVIAIYIIIKYMRKSYDRERAEVEEKAVAIEVRNEQISLQKDELELNIAEKNKLMSILSHDLRAPLINIQNYLELLNENEIDKDDRPLIEKELLTATNHTMDMLSNLLYWSRSQMNGVTVNLLTVNLFSVLKSTLEIEKILAEKKNITLNYTIEQDIIVLADIDMLQLVVRNLINNAIKFTPDGGAIHIEAQRIKDKCKLIISDNGKGIAEDKKDSLFSIKSGPTYGTNNEKGVGLGLLLCKEFIERQGGSIGFESNLMQGSRFFIYIPLNQ